MEQDAQPTPGAPHAFDILGFGLLLPNVRTMLGLAAKVELILDLIGMTSSNRDTKVTELSANECTPLFEQRAMMTGLTAVYREDRQMAEFMGSGIVQSRCACLVRLTLASSGRSLPSSVITLVDSSMIPLPILARPAVV